MIHLKQPLVLSAQGNVGSPLFASPSSAAASCQQRRGTGGRSRRWLMLQRISCSSTEQSLGVSSVTVDRTIKVTATVTVQPPLGVVYAARGLDDLGDLFGKTLLLELVSSELDPKTGLEKERVVGFAHKTKKEGTYEAKFSVPASFGPAGAVLVENEHHKEMFIKEIKLVTGDDESTAVTFDCNSWAHSKFAKPQNLQSIVEYIF